MSEENKTIKIKINLDYKIEQGHEKVENVNQNYSKRTLRDIIQLKFQRVKFNSKDARTIRRIYNNLDEAVDSGKDYFEVAEKDTYILEKALKDYQAVTQDIQNILLFLEQFVELGILEEED